MNKKYGIRPEIFKDLDKFKMSLSCPKINKSQQQQQQTLFSDNIMSTVAVSPRCYIGYIVLPCFQIFYFLYSL